MRENCSKTYGFIIGIIKLLNYGEGVIQDTTADVLFEVTFQALIFKPYNGEVLDGVVTEVSQNCLNVEVGPLLVMISKENLPGDYEYAPTDRVYNSSTFSN